MYILFIIISLAFSSWFGLWFAIDSDLIHHLRNRFIILYRKPFSCAGCMAFWACLGIQAAGWAWFPCWPVAAVLPFIAYGATRQIDSITKNPFE